MIRKTAGTFAVKVSIAAINLIITILLSRWMGAQGKGEASLIIVGITMLMLFCNMIGGAPLIYLVPRYNVFQLAVMSNLWTVVVCTVFYFILSWSVILPAKFVLHVCLLTLINSFLSTNVSILLGKEKIAGNNFILFLQATINLVVLVVLVRSFGENNTGSYITSLYVAMLTCLFISSILVFNYLKDISFKGSGKIIRELVRFGFTNQLGHFMNFISFRISYLLLNKYCLEAGVGVYSNGVSLIESILLISNSMATVQYPAIANSSDKAYSQEITIRLTRLNLLLCFFTVLPLLLLPESFYTWLFGREFEGVKNVILILSPGILFYSMALLIGHYFSGTGKYKINTASNFVGLIVTVALSSIFLSHYSINVAAAITMASYVAVTGTLFYSFVKDSGIRITALIPSFKDLKWAISNFKY